MQRFIKLISKNPLYLFSSKKVKQPIPLKVSRFKLNDKIGGHLIYETNKMKNFMIVGIVLGSGVILSALLFRAQKNGLNIIPLFMIITSLIVYQRRISQTIKTIVVQKTGQKLILNTYGIMGTDIFKQQAVIPIHLMKGISQKRINKAIIIKGGGVFGFKPFSYYFHENGVLDKLVFDTVMGGHCIKYSDIL